MFLLEFFRFLSLLLPSLSFSFSFILQEIKKSFLSPRTFQKRSRTGQWAFLKGVWRKMTESLPPRHCFFQVLAGQFTNFFFNMSNFEPSCKRVFVSMNLQYQVYTQNVSISDQGYNGALKKYRIEFTKGLGHPPHLANMPYYFICTQYMFWIITHWSKLIEIIKFWLPCTENNCSAWHLNKTIIF